MIGAWRQPLQRSITCISGPKRQRAPDQLRGRRHGSWHSLPVLPRIRRSNVANPSRYGPLTDARRCRGADSSQYCARPARKCKAFSATKRRHNTRRVNHSPHFVLEASRSSCSSSGAVCGCESASEIFRPQGEAEPLAVDTSTEYLTPVGYSRDVSGVAIPCSRTMAHFGCLILPCALPPGVPSARLADRQAKTTEIWIEREPPRYALELPVILVSQSGGLLFQNGRTLHRAIRGDWKILPGLLSPQPLTPNL